MRAYTYKIFFASIMFFTAIIGINVYVISSGLISDSRITLLIFLSLAIALLYICTCSLIVSNSDYGDTDIQLHSVNQDEDNEPLPEYKL